MAEWLNAPVLKTGILKGIWGSNPCFSAYCGVLENDLYVCKFGRQALLSRG